MRWFLLGTLMLAAAPAALPAQAAANASAHAPALAARPSLKDDLADWQHVEVLPRGTYIHVNTAAHRTTCSLLSSDRDALTCDRDTGVGHRRLVFQRGEVREVKLVRHGRSAVLGGVIGAGVGAAVGGIQGTQSNYFVLKGAWAMIYGFAGGFAGAPIGYVTDFTASTVYRAK